MSNTTSLRFREISSPVVLEDAEALVPAIKTVFPGWGWQRLSRRSPIPAGISFTRHGDKFQRHSQWVEKIDLDDDPADAMCNFVSDIIDTYIEEHPGILGIHASAIRFGATLIVIPSTHRSGKSLLTTHLINQGGVLFSDDVLLLSKRGHYGIATGIAPRLRLPVPVEKGSTLPDFLSQAGMCSNQRYGWVNLHPGQVAKLGSKAKIQTLLLLDRQENQNMQPKLAPVSNAEALARLIRRGFSLDSGAGEVLARLSAIVKQAKCYQLSYDSAQQAAIRLKDQFGY